MFPIYKMLGLLCVAIFQEVFGELSPSSGKFYKCGEQIKEMI
jgi:hypothetical protein